MEKEYIRKKCNVEGCENLVQMCTKRKDGSIYYRKVCAKHHRARYGMKNGSKDIKKFRTDILDISLLPCVSCGWKKSFCDRHRVIPGEKGGRYEIGNVIPLCPNCHREIHEMIKKC